MIKHYIKPQIEWTEEKIELLKKEYPLGNKKELAKKLNIKDKTLKAAASRFKIKSLKDINHYKLEFLTKESSLSYYWLGFILADGYIGQNRGELKITLNNRDKNHLEKLGKILNIKVKTKIVIINNIQTSICILNCADIYNSKIIYNKLGLDLNLPKTYNPPIKLNINNDIFFLSFLLGIIDGDGTFSKRKNNVTFIRIEVHKNWHDYLIQIKEKLNSIGFDGISVNFTKRGYVYLRICRKQNFIALKNFALNNNLPILERKWNLVNEKENLTHHSCKINKDLQLNFNNINSTI